MSNERKVIREISRKARKMGFDVVSSIGGGRHGQKIVIVDKTGKLHTVPVAGGTGNGKTKHTANAIAQLKRIMKGMQQ